MSMYPELHTVDEPIIEQASAPVDEARSAIDEQKHSKLCAMCSDVFNAQPEARGILSCGHVVHAQCLAKLLLQKKLKASEMGGVAFCSHCRASTNSTGVCTVQTNPEVSFDNCIQRVHELHLRAFPSQNCSLIADEQSTPDIVDTILGVVRPTAYAKMGAVVSKGIGSITNIISSRRSGNDEPMTPGGEDEPLSEEQIENERWRTRLHGSELVDEMVRTKRTIGSVFATRKITLPYLYVAGIDTIALLHKIGFVESTHLLPEYRAVVPVFFLVDKYGMSYDEHLQQLTCKTLASFKLNKYEVRLLGITVPKLIKRGVTRRTLISFNLKPSHMIKFMALEAAHLKCLGFTNEDFKRNEAWLADCKRNTEAKEIRRSALEKK